MAVVDHHLRRQVALALARPAGLRQHPAHPVGRHRPGDHAEADVVAQTDAGRKAGRNTGHRCRSLNAGPPAYACRTPNLTALTLAPTPLPHIPADAPRAARFSPL